jgi:tetraacyldisaccharide 4'-kinase
VRKPPSFWRDARPGPAAYLLTPVAALYGRIAGWRMNRPPLARAAAPTICVGNFVLGGAGKTPTAIALARIARARGLRPGFLTRGYGGATKGPLLVDLATHRAADVGDEALLLAAVAPTVVSESRPAGANRLQEEDIDLVIMDDGFQNPSLAKDISFVAVDAATGIGNGLVFPAGPLRAPLATQMQHADALVVIGEGHRADPVVRVAARAGRGVLRARLKPVRVKEWRKTPILAFAGIGRPDKFFASLTEIEAPVAKTVSFPDHHTFTEADAEKLLGEADARKLRLVTTEKDLARLAGAEGVLGRLRDRSDAFAVVLEFENLTAVTEMIADVTRAMQGREKLGAR